MRRRFRTVLVLVLANALLLAVTSGPAAATCTPEARTVPRLVETRLSSELRAGTEAVVTLRVRQDRVTATPDGTCMTTIGGPLTGADVQVIAQPSSRPDDVAATLVFAARPAAEPGVYRVEVSLPVDERWSVRASIGLPGGTAVIPLEAAELVVIGGEVAGSRVVGASASTSPDGLTAPLTVAFLASLALAVVVGAWWRAGTVRRLRPPETPPGALVGRLGRSGG